ncbi:MAG: SUMF1/EgtB/PvdO family nonheme iron enzyme [Blastocatellia bacterium]|nr:SUMF1/EgtB/PvdO family nonheme iron enzyme [Blastocatellia bacterium]
MLEPNTVLQNRYRIVRKLGQGGMGAVYEATDHRFNSIVALKETLVTEEHLRKAFEREARLLNGLRHAALPVVMDYFSEADGVYLIMQYIPGEDFATLLEQRDGPFPHDKVLVWGDVLLNALDYLHEHEPPVIHRDIKPQNLKLTPRGEVVLLDFGLAKGAAGGLEPATAASSVLGYTPHYAPFEQIQGSGTDARSDLYSLAATLYHLMTGVMPVDALTRTAAILRGNPDPQPPANKVNPDVPAEVASVLTRAMSVNQEDRPATATEMRHALRAAAGGPPVTRLQGSPTGAVPKVAPAPAGASLDQKTEIAATPVKSSAGKQEAATVIDTSHVEPARAQPKSGSRSRTAVIAAALVVIAGLAAAAWLWSGQSSTVSQATPHTAAIAPVSAADNTGPGGMPLKSFAFDVVTVDGQGAVTDTSRGEAQYFAEDLGAGVTLDMVKIPGGVFLMGSPGSEKGRFGEEGPQHNVELPSFYMGRFEVTQAQWRAVAGLPKVNRDLNASPAQFEGVNRPVERVSWEEAVEFCERLSKKTGRTYRLPSEAEWEYACRAGTTTPFHFGENITPELANYDGIAPYESGPKGISRKQTTPVGNLDKANRFGLYGMHGNVWEWCADPWHMGYNEAPLDGSVWESGGDTSKRIIRGGAWNRMANHCRSAYRLKDSPGAKFDVIGFRVVMAATSQ